MTSKEALDRIGSEQVCLSKLYERIANRYLDIDCTVRKPSEVIESLLEDGYTVEELLALNFNQSDIDLVK